MKKFLRRFCLFLALVFGIFLLGVFLPATPRAKQSLLFAKPTKDSLLLNVPSPRLIMVGGSNLSFGVNSQMIRDSIGVYPINTAIQASLGLVYMMNNTLNFIRKGDVVLVAPEYQQFFGDFAYGEEELLRTVFDVSGEKVTNLSFAQWRNIFPYIFKYSFSKFQPYEYFNIVNDPVYCANCFNEYGDITTHWNMPREKFSPDGVFEGDINLEVISALLKFKENIEQKGAVLLLTFPCYQSSSFNNNSTKIKTISLELEKNNFTLLGTPERYRIPDSLMFNTSFHLIKTGLDQRTMLLIEDLKKSKYFTKEQPFN